MVVLNKVVFIGSDLSSQKKCFATPVAANWFPLQSAVDYHFLLHLWCWYSFATTSYMHFVLSFKFLNGTAYLLVKIRTS